MKAHGKIGLLSWEGFQRQSDGTGGISLDHQRLYDSFCGKVQFVLGKVRYLQQESMFTAFSNGSYVNKGIIYCF